MRLLKFVIIPAVVLMSQLANAETVQVKYHGAISLDAFTCTEVKENSDVSRICYDNAERYMLIQLKATYYHYCEIDAVTLGNFRRASLKRQFFDKHIRGSGTDGPYDCRTRPIPKKYRN